jgi:3-hydroxyisobutyrate dehydrogenase
MRVGLAGLGRMGTAMALRLLEMQIPLTVWNRTKEKAAGFRSKASVAAASHALAQESDIVLSVVADDAAARELFLGSNGLLTGNVDGKLFIEMSTLKPGTVFDLNEASRRVGARFVESPVMGTVGPARAGKLVCLFGGEPTDLALAEPVLRQLSRRVLHVGPVGTACIAKLAVNSVLLTYLQALAEGLSFAVSGGLKAESLLEVIAESPANTPLLSIKADILRGRVPDPSEIGASLTTIRKDLLSVTAVASEAGVPMPAAAVTLMNVAAACAAGWSQRDIAELVAFHRMTTADLERKA